MHQQKRKLLLQRCLTSFLVFAVTAATLLGASLNPPKATAATRTWDGGCGANTNWSCAANWSLDTIPTSADTVTFDNTSDNNSTVDSLFNATETIVTININSGYDGTITLATPLTVSTTFSQAAGTFTAAGQSLNLSAFTLSGGTFTASSGTTTISGAVTVSGSPTFNHNSGTINFSGSTATIACSTIALNAATFTNTNTKTISAGCTIPLGNNPTIANSVTVNGTISGTGTITATTGTLILGTTGSFSGFTGVTTTGTITINGTLNAGSYTTFVAGAFNLTSTAVFTAPSGSMTLNGNVTFTTGFTFNANGGTVTLGANGTIACNGATFNLVTITGLSSNTKNLSTGCTLPLGANPTVPVQLTVNGTVSGTGTITVNSTFTYNSTGSFSGFSGFVSSSPVTINGTLNAGSYTTFDMNGTFALSATGNFTAPSGTATFASTFTITAGATFNANGGTVTFDGSTATISCGSVTFNLVNISNAGNTTKTISSNCTLPLGNNPTVGADLNTDISLAGTLTGTGTITFGTSASTNSFTLQSTGSLSGFSGLSAGTVVAQATANFSSYTTFIVNGAYSQNSNNTITVPNGADFNNTFALATSSGAVFNAPSGTMTVANSFTLNTGTTFNANGGTLTFDGTSNATLTCNNTVFSMVTFAHTSNRKTVSSDCSLPLGTNPTLGVGNSALITTSGAFSGSGTITFAGSITLETGYSFTGFSGLIANGSVIVNAATANFGSYTTFDLNSTFTINSPAVFTAPSGTATFGSAFLISAGATFNANGGSIIFDTGGGTITCNGAAFNNVTFNFPGSGTRTIDSTCNIPLGNNPTITGGRIVLNGTFSGTGNLNVTANLGPTMTMNTGATLSGFSSFSILGGFVISGATVDMSSYTTADFNGTDGFTINSGTFTAPPVMTLEGSMNITVGTFNAGGGILTFDGSTAATLNCGSTTFSSVVFANTASSKTVNSDCNLPLGSNPHADSGGSIKLFGTLSGSGTLFTSGTFSLENGFVLTGFTGINANNLLVDNATANFGSYNTMDMDGNLTLQNSAVFTATSANMTIGDELQVNTGTTFNHNNGTVIFDGDDQAIIGSAIFNNLTKIVASSDTFVFPTGATQTVLGALTFKGGSSSQLTLRSSSPGSLWQIDPHGTIDVQYVTVSDSQNIGNTITTCGSINGGNNSGWAFPSSCGSTTGTTTSLTTTTTSAATGSSSTSTKKSSSSNSSSSIDTPTDVTETSSTENNSVTSPINIDTSSDSSIQRQERDAGKGSNSWIKVTLAIVLLVTFGLGFLILFLLKRRHSSDTTPPSMAQVITPPSVSPTQPNRTDKFIN